MRDNAFVPLRHEHKKAWDNIAMKRRVSATKPIDSIDNKAHAVA